MNFEDEDSGYKILIIGPPNAGKTTYITRYVHEEYFTNEAYKKTIGVDFALKHLDMDDGRHVTLQLWDIAGEERTQMMNRLYYQDAHACVIMFDITYEKSLGICLKWKKDLDSKCTLDNGDPIPCILLANKIDLTNKRKHTSEEVRQFAEENNFLHYMETSVKTNLNVEESMRYLVDNILTHDNLPRTRRKNSDTIILKSGPTPSDPESKKSKCCIMKYL